MLLYTCTSRPSNPAALLLSVTTSCTLALHTCTPLPWLYWLAHGRYCGACWAFGTTSSLSDRLRIQSHHHDPELVLSAQVLLNCGGGGTCRVSVICLLQFASLYHMPHQALASFTVLFTVCSHHSYTWQALSTNPAKFLPCMAHEQSETTDQSQTQLQSTACLPAKQKHKHSTAPCYLTKPTACRVLHVHCFDRSARY